MSSTELATTKTGAVATQPTTDLTLQAGQSDFTPAQRAALAQLGVEEASDDDVKVFFHQCRTTGLDPFRKQIYMIGRRTKVKVWNPNTREQEEKWVMKQTIQIGIDGYRLACRRVANALGIKVDTDGPYWHDGEQWRDVWLDSATPPKAAKFTIIRDGEKYTAIANYAEYVQTFNTQQGPKPTSMWAKMPANQIAKCAEAAARRQAFPDQFSGVVFEDAAHQVIDGTVEQSSRTKAPQGRGVAALEAMATQAVEPASDSEPRPEQPPVKGPAKPTKKQWEDLNRLFTAGGAETDAAKYIVLNRMTNRDEPITDTKGLTRDEVADFIATLDGLQTESVLVETVENMLIEDAQAKEAQS